jgi:transcriptional regulator with XRE-family HTH domain
VSLSSFVLPIQKTSITAASGRLHLSNQQLKVESEGPRTGTSPVPIRADESELKDRLRQVIGDESGNGFARRAGVTESALRKYLDGAMPSADRLVKLALAGDVSIEWLATGQGPRYRAAAGAVSPTASLDDLQRLQDTIEAVEKGLRAIDRTLSPAKYAELVVAAYELMAAPTTSSAQIVQFIKAAAR